MQSQCLCMLNLYVVYRGLFYISYCTYVLSAPSSHLIVKVMKNAILPDNLQLQLSINGDRGYRIA